MDSQPQGGESPSMLNLYPSTQQKAVLLETEYEVVGCLLWEESLYPQYQSILNSSMFVDAGAKAIMVGIERLAQQHQPINITTVASNLQEYGELNQIRIRPESYKYQANAVGAAALLLLQSKSGPVVNLPYHVAKLRERWGKATLHTQLRELTQAATDPDSDVFELLQEVNYAVSNLSESLSVSQYQVYDAGILQDLIAKPQKGLPGHKTGFHSLDRAIGGYIPPEITVVAGRPGAGKTAFMLASAVGVARSGTPLAFFSLDTSTSQMMARLACQLAGVPKDALKFGNLTAQQAERLMETATPEMQNNFVMVDKVTDVGQIVAEIARLKATKNIGVVFIDYIQMVGFAKSPNKSNNRTYVIEDVIKELKQAAKKYEVAIHCAAQLSRAVDDQRRGDKRATMADLADSSAIEKYADVVAALFRPSYYGYTVDKDNKPYPEHALYVDLLKVRDGERKTLLLSYELETQKIVDHPDTMGFSNPPSKNAYEDLDVEELPPMKPFERPVDNEPPPF